MYVVGITGGIGSGKTTVTKLFEALSIDVVDADVIARHIFDLDSPALAAVADRFGADALHSDGTLNRAWLRERIFTNTDDKDWLNSLTHPLIRQQLLQQLHQATSPYVLLSAPLLVENKLTEICDQVLVVDITPAQQIERTIGRDQVTKSQVEAIIAAQASREERLAAAHQVIDNSADPASLVPQVEALHNLYLRLAQDNTRSN